MKKIPKLLIFLIILFGLVILPNYNNQKISDERLILANKDILNLNSQILENIKSINSSLLEHRYEFFMKGGSIEQIDFSLSKIKKYSHSFDEAIISLINSFLKTINIDKNEYEQYIQYAESTNSPIGIKLKSEKLKKLKKRNVNLGNSRFSFRDRKNLDLEELLMTMRDSVITEVLYNPPEYYTYERPKKLDEFQQTMRNKRYEEAAEPFFYELYFDEADRANNDIYYNNYDVLKLLEVLNSELRSVDCIVSLNQLITTLRFLQENVYAYYKNIFNSGFNFTKVKPRLKKVYGSNRYRLEYVDELYVFENELRYSLDDTIPKSDWVYLTQDEYQKNQIELDTLLQSPTLFYFDINYINEDDTIWFEMKDTIGPSQFENYN